MLSSKNLKKVIQSFLSELYLDSKVLEKINPLQWLYKPLIFQGVRRLF